MILRFLRGSKLLFVTSMLASALAALADMVSPQIVRVAVDHVLGSAPTETLPGFAVRLIGRAGGVAALREHIWILALAVVAVAVVKAAAQYGYEVSKTAASETLVKTMRDSLFSHIERLPYAWHMKNRTGDIIQRCTSDIDTLKNFLAEQMTNLIRIVILLALSVAFMLGMNPRLTLIAMLPVPVIIGYSLYFHKKIGEAFLACDENEGILSTLAQENLTGVRVVRAFGRERDERDRFEKQNRYYTGLWMKLARPLATFWSVGDVLSGLQILLTVVFGAVFCIRGSMGPGAYIAFLSYCAMMTWPVRMLGRMISEMSKAGVSLDRIRYIMESPEEETSVGLTPDLSGDIVFDRVSFGTDLREIRTDYLRRNIGMVLQEPFLFSRTIAENIGIHDPELGIDRIRESARAACLDETVMGFARGYDTPVGERGLTLSGGQKQRTAIARTLSQDVPILVFDDSLSAVDAETDAKIRRALQARFGRATVILISHRITTLSKADKILVLDHGRIAEQGTHEELRKAGGLYQHICAIQSGAGEAAV